MCDPAMVLLALLEENRAAGRPEASSASPFATLMGPGLGKFATLMGPANRLGHGATRGVA